MDLRVDPTSALLRIAQMQALATALESKPPATAIPAAGSGFATQLALATDAMSANTAQQPQPALPTEPLAEPPAAGPPGLSSPLPPF